MPHIPQTAFLLSGLPAVKPTPGGALFSHIPEAGFLFLLIGSAPGPRCPKAGSLPSAFLPNPVPFAELPRLRSATLSRPKSGPVSASFFLQSGRKGLPFPLCICGFSLAAVLPCLVPVPSFPKPLPCNGLFLQAVFSIWDNWKFLEGAGFLPLPKPFLHKRPLLLPLLRLLLRLLPPAFCFQTLPLPVVRLSGWFQFLLKFYPVLSDFLFPAQSAAQSLPEAGA